MTGAQEATLATLSALAIHASLRHIDAVFGVTTSWTAEEIAAADLEASRGSFAALPRYTRSTRAVLGTLRAEGYVTVSSGGRWRPTATGIRAVLR